VETAAQALATSPLIANGDYEAFQRQASDFLRSWAPDEPDIYAVILRDLNGRQLVNTRLPWGTPLPANTDFEPDRKVLETKQPYVSDVFTGAVSRTPLFAITVPVLRNGQVAYFLNKSLPARRIREVIEQENPPPAWTVTVVDRKGAILARSHSEAQFVGKSAASDLLERSTGPEGAWTGTDVEGVPVFAAYARSKLADWRVVVSVPRAELEAPLRRSLGLFALLGVTLVLLSMMLAVAFGRRITGALHALAGSAKTLGQGGAVSPIPAPITEVKQVGDALAAASIALRERARERARFDRERARAERRRELLVRELNHRVKNTLATIQSIAAMTARMSPDLETFQRAFEDRLVGLSKTHDLLTAGEWEGASLQDLLRNELEPYSDETGRRVRLEGEAVHIEPKLALALGMAVHELATNAAKYGALSVPNGRVTVMWHVEAIGDGRCLHLNWVERGGPRVEAPQRQGFGSRLITRGLARELGGEIPMEFAPEGFRCTMRLPLSHS
jgi:two-component sensor histidine kinase